MDPISHGIIGAGVFVLSGGEPSLVEPAFLACMVGSLAPDIDIVARLKNDYHYLKYHRGISHSFIGCGVLSAVIALIFNLIFSGSSFFNIFIWTYVGCLSHVFFDFLNSYGVKLLWPFNQKKYSLSILKLYDIFILALCAAAIILKKASWQYKGTILTVLLVYLIVLGVMRYIARRKVANFFKGRVAVESVKILPSIIGFFKWDFIIMSQNHYTVGQVYILKDTVKIREKLRRINKKERDKLLRNKAGKFFKEFTPIFHIDVKKRRDKVEVIYTDLRYWLRNQFMHHATAVYNENGQLVDTIFHPYRKSNRIRF